MPAALHPSLACATGWELCAGRHYQTGTLDSFACAHTHTEKRAILAPIVSLRSFIVSILFLEVLMLAGDWKSCDAGWRLSSASAFSRVQSGCWCTHLGLGDVAGGPASLASVSGGWEKQFTETVIWEKCKTQLNCSGWLLFYIYLFFIVIRGSKLADWSERCKRWTSLGKWGSVFSWLQVCVWSHRAENIQSFE